MPTDTEFYAVLFAGLAALGALIAAWVAVLAKRDSAKMVVEAQKANSYKQYEIEESKRIRVNCTLGYGKYHKAEDMRVCSFGAVDGFKREGFGVIINMTNAGRDFVLIDARLTMWVEGLASEAKPKIALRPHLPQEIAFNNGDQEYVLFFVPDDALHYFQCDSLTLGISITDDSGQATSKDLSKLNTTALRKWCAAFVTRIQTQERELVPYSESDIPSYGITSVECFRNGMAARR